MSYPGQLTAIGALALSALSGVEGTVTAESDNPTLAPEYIDRTDALPVYVASTVAPLTLTVALTGIQTYEQRRTLLRALRYPQTDETIRLRAWVGDPDSLTAASIDVTIASIDAQPGSITVQCVAAGGVWRAATATTAGPYSFTDDGAVALASAGEAVTFATYKVGWATQRASSSAGVGWKYRRQVTVTNNTERDWINRPVCVDLGDTAAWVTGGKALSSGDDLRVRVEGIAKYRTLVNWNSERTFVWFLVTLKAGAAQTVDLVYGNPSANTPTTLSTRNGTLASYIAFDLQGDFGTATSGGASTITNSGETWETNQWRGGYIQITGGTGALQRRRIASNTGTEITVTRAWTTNPANGSRYVLWRSGIAVDGGAVSSHSFSTASDSSQAWGTNQWAGATIRFGAGTTADPTTMTVESNTATQLTFTSSFSTRPTVGDTYRIERYGVHTYAVDPAVYDLTHLDLWRRNTYYSKPSRIWYGNQTPGGWTPTLYLDNGDDFAQSRVFDIGSGGGHSENWRGTLRARRARSQDNTYPDEGQADGVSVYAPEGYQSIYYDYQLKNESGVGKFVISVLDPGGEDWRDVVTNSTTYASLGAGTISPAWRDLSGDGSPTRIYMGVLPADGVAIPSSVATTEEIEARTYQRLELYLDIDGIGGLSSSILSAGSEDEVYDLVAYLRLGGGSEDDITPPYDRLRIGGSDHSIYLKSTEVLWISTDPEDNRPFAAVYNTSDVLQYTCPWAVRAYRHEANDQGDTVALVARQIMPIAPQTTYITNGTFASDTTGWTLTAPAGTVTWSRDAGVYFDAAGSLKAALATGTDTGRAISTAFTTVVGEAYTLALAVKTDSASIDDIMYVALRPYVVPDGGAGTPEPLIIVSTITNAVDLGFTTDWQTYSFQFTATDDSYVLRFDVLNTIGGAANVWLDQITVGLPSLYLTEASMGELTLEIDYRDRYLS